jgi:hypothetical protein
MPKLVAGWVLGTHNFNCKSSSLFTRKTDNCIANYNSLYDYEIQSLSEL